MDSSRSVLLLVLLCLLCTGVSSDSYWDIELSPQSISSVPFGLGHIAVWEHATSTGRYYAMPLVYLLPNTSQTVHNIVTGDVELKFNVLMWSLEAKESVYRHLKQHVSSDLQMEQIELLPMEKIRIVWKDRVRSLSSDFKLADQWKSNTHLPSVIQFQFLCKDLTTCNSLKNAMRTSPDMFNGLELEYIINGQRSARRSMTVTANHLTRGRLFTKLSNMAGVSSGERFVTSDDMKTITSESVANAIASVVTDADYVDTGDEVNMENALQRVLQREQVSTENFTPQMWNSVFWDRTWARPDKLTNYLNKVLTKDTSDSRKFILNENERSESAEGGAGGSFMGIISIEGSGGGSSSSASKVQKEDVLNTLRERHNNVEWTGEQFRVKPMKLHRLNVATLNTSTTIATANIQVRRYETVHSIKLRTGEASGTPSLTPQLVLARLTATIDQKFLEAKQKIANAEAKIRSQATKISQSDAGWKERFGRLDRVMNAWPDYCRIRQRDCGGWDIRRVSADLNGCKNACNVDCKCKSFIYVDRSRYCWLKHITCRQGQLSGHGTADYYVKVTRSPVHFGSMKWALTNSRPEHCSDPCDIIM